MSAELLTNYLIVSALLFTLGIVGFVTRRNLIVMFISAELMLQAVSLNLAAFNQYHRALGTSSALDGQVFVLFILVVAAAEAAIALALVVVLFRRVATLDVSVWQSLREPGQPPVLEEPPAELEPSPAQLEWPHLPPAGVLPARDDRRPATTAHTATREPVNTPRTGEEDGDA
jgi:NADH-quinone oxidoreductase subunit K